MEHLTDAPISNIVILTALVFLAVGVFGKVGGFLGSILGTIEASRNARILSGLLGVALMVVGLIMHSQADNARAASDQHPGNPGPVTAPLDQQGQSGSPNTPVPTSAPQHGQAAPAPKPVPGHATPTPTSEPRHARSLEGTWVYSTNNVHNALHKLEISQQGTRLQVHAWGRCEAQDCDWGMKEVPLSGDTATAMWILARGNRQAVVTLEPIESRHLRVIVRNTYADGKTTQYEYPFVKAE